MHQVSIDNTNIVDTRYHLMLIPHLDIKQFRVCIGIIECASMVLKGFCA